MSTARTKRDSRVLEQKGVHARVDLDGSLLEDEIGAREEQGQHVERLEGNWAVSTVWTQETRTGQLELDGQRWATEGPGDEMDRPALHERRARGVDEDTEEELERGLSVSGLKRRGRTAIAVGSAWSTRVCPARAVRWAGLPASSWSAPCKAAMRSG